MGGGTINEYYHNNVLSLCLAAAAVMDESRERSNTPSLLALSEAQAESGARRASLLSSERLLGARGTSLASHLEADRLCARRPLFHRQHYLARALDSAEGMYSTDIRGHTGCINAVTFSNLGEHFLASGR